MSRVFVGNSGSGASVGVKTHCIDVQRMTERRAFRRWPGRRVLLGGAAVTAVLAGLWFLRSGRMHPPAWTMSAAWPVAAFDGGQAVAMFTRADGIPTLVTVDPKTGRVGETLAEDIVMLSATALPDGRLVYARNDELGRQAAVCVWDGTNSRVIAERGKSAAVLALQTRLADAGKAPPYLFVAGVAVRQNRLETAFRTTATDDSEAVITEVSLDFPALTERSRRDVLVTDDFEYTEDHWWVPAGFGAAGFEAAAERFGLSERPLTAEELHNAVTDVSSDTLAVASWWRD